MKDSILVVGSPRSGTTWLMDILCTLPGYTSIFEPLNPIWFPESFQVGYRSRTYLKKDSIWPQGEEYLRKIFSGQIANLPIKNSPLDLINTFSLNNFFNHFLGTKLVIKSINMNRILPWITKNFQLRNVFYIIRHPCATIASQLKTGLYGYRNSSYPYHDILPNIENIITEISEITDLDHDLKVKLQKIKKTEEILAAIWCLDNFIPLSCPKLGQWNTIIYEKMLKHGDVELKKLFESLGEKNIPKTAYYYLKKPSAVTLKEEQKLVKKPEYQISKWKTYLSEKQIARILKILSYFNIDQYSEDFEPRYEKFI